jgi:hypothetical protein
LCETLRSSFLTPNALQGIAGNGPVVDYATWPSTSQLAPGCVVGCGRCAITGDSVELFYWPTSTPNVSATITESARSRTEEVVLDGMSKSLAHPYCLW